ncbi:MAG TPA: phage major capsid protein [Dermatophilaceae bacterium]
MSNYLDRARSKMDALSTELGSILSLHGEDESKWNPGILERHNRLIKGLDRATLEYDALSARGDKIEQIRAAAMNPANRESGFGGRALASSSHSATRAWDGYDSRGSIGALDNEDGLRSRALVACAEMDGLEPDSREKLDAMVRADRTSGEAKALLALGNPAYRSAFDSWLQDPVSAAMRLDPEESAAWRDVTAFRTAMGIGNSGALMPLTLDPSVILTNVGSTSSIRQYAKIVTTLTNQYRAVVSPGTTAEWKTEGAEASDASPAVSAADIPVYFADQSINASFELWADTDLSQQLGTLIADGFKVQEDAVFVAGSGSGAPYGALTRISATTGSRVSPTTASTFTTASVADIFKVRDAVPTRHRTSGSTAWISNIAIQSVVQQMGVSQVGPNAFWADMGSGSPANLLGFPNLEATSMTGTIGASANILALVDWSRYVVADRIGTTLVVGNMVGTNGRSIASKEVFAYRRYGADLIDVNAGRVLKL